MQDERPHGTEMSFPTDQPPLKTNQPLATGMKVTHPRSSIHIWASQNQDNYPTNTQTYDKQ